MTDPVKVIARSIRECLQTFRDPVHLYVENEAYDRAGPDADLEQDWAARSYEIIARAALDALDREGAAIQTWQTIETAPEGIPVIVWPDYWGQARVAKLSPDWSGGLVWYEHDGEGWSDYDAWYHREGRGGSKGWQLNIPTHWHPLPKLPDPR